MQVSVSVSFEAENEDEAQEKIGALNLPPGANVNVSMVSSLTMGTVGEDGAIEPVNV